MTTNPKFVDNAKKNASRRGVALVIVLGVLSVIVILAVSFAITMRTERVAASNASDNVKARQLLDVALTRALLFLYAGLTNQIYPPWGATNSSLRLDPLSGTFDTNWYTDKGLALEDFTNRVQTYWETNGLVPGFLYGEASNHVPQAFWDEAWNSSANYTYWEPVVQPVAGTNQGRVIGRVAYLVINCSGLLDANFVSATNALPRMYGTNAGEIEISDFMQDISSVAGFQNNRANNYRYETYPHLLEGNGGECWANFFIHSLALPGYSTNFDASPHERNICTSIFIGGDPAALLAARPAITNALARAFTNLTAGQPALLFTNLLDYAAAQDSQPIGSLQAQSVRTMPMINELLITNQFTRVDASNYTARSSFTVEYWNPFPVGASNFSRRVWFSAFFRPQAGGNAWITNYLSSATPVPLADVSPHNFRVVSSNVVTSILVGTDLAGQAGRIDVSFTASVYNAGNFEVDRTVGSQSFNFTVPTIAGGATALVWRLECVDPRFNWNANNSTQWQAAAVHSLGMINNAASNYWQANPDCDRDAAMYCAGRPLMSQAELSYLAYDRWKTLPITGTLMLDAFTIETNSYLRGMANPNSDMPEALAAAFYNMPVGQYAGDPAGLNNRLSWDDAMRLANHIIANGPYTNLSDLARQNIWSGFFGDFSRPDLLTNSLVRECFIRDSVRLLNVRQNVFTVLLVAELAGIDGRFAIFGVRQRAVAVVWRDPYANRFRVHFIKLLRD